MAEIRNTENASFRENDWALLVGAEAGALPLENSLVVPNSFKHMLLNTCNSQYKLRKIKGYIHTKTFERMLTGFFLTVKHWEQPKYLLRGERNEDLTHE